MAARFAVISGRSINGSGKCENLEKIAFRKREKKLRNMVYKKFKVNIKLYVLYLNENWFRGRAIHRRV